MRLSFPHGAPSALPCLLGAAAILLGAASPAEAAPGAATRASLSMTYGQLPLSFEANQGQVDQAVQFLSRGQGYTLFLIPGEAVLRLSRQGGGDAVVRLAWAGSNRYPRMRGEGLQAARSSYFLGNDPRQWHAGVPNYAQVRYEGIYPGVDLFYRGNQRQLEYDLVVAPRADPGRIRLIVRGADEVALGAEGELVLHTANGNLVQHAPEVYQVTEGRRERVEGHYVLLPAPARKSDSGRPGALREVGFAVGRYDRTRPLIIDPILAYSSFLGGTGEDFGRSIAVDGAGNAYVTGETSSTAFPGVGGGSLQPAAGGGTDAFVTKINALGTAIVYSTFLGGSGDDVGSGIAVDGTGNAYILGGTSSHAFPGVSASSIQPVYGGGVYDAFVTKLDATGAAILYSTFLGGSGEELSRAIAVDGAGNAYVTGATNSPTFPGVAAGSIQPAYGGGISDAFVTKINPTGTAIVYSTFLGGSGSEIGLGIAVDGKGNAFVTGNTDSTTFPGVSASSIQPARGGGADAFVTKINPAGTAIVYSTFLGGTDTDEGDSIAVDCEGNVYVTGFTLSTTFPGVNGSSMQPTIGGASDAFVTKINAAGTAIVYSTYLGGAGNDQGAGIAVDGSGHAYVTGYTYSLTFPGVSGSSIQPANGGGIDAFVTKLEATGTAIRFSTFLGGSGNDHGTRIAVDGNSNAYVTGFTDSPTLPGVSGSLIQPASGGGTDAFVIKIGEAGRAFFTVSPCRMVDTRNAAGPRGGPALQPGAARTFLLSDVCGVPSSATALAVNVTVTQPTAAGYLRLLPADLCSLPFVSTINYAPGQTRANNAVAALASDGSGGLEVVTNSAGSVHFILDVMGYFE